MMKVFSDEELRKIISDNDAADIPDVWEFVNLTQDLFIRAYNKGLEAGLKGKGE